jgi:acyl-CoA thioester hydrolase
MAMTKAKTFDGWDLPSPFIHRIVATAADEDEFGHVNNARYLTWGDETAWAHWDFDVPEHPRTEFVRYEHGMAIVRSECDYLGHCHAGDDLDCAVWITKSDGRLRAERRYQFRRADAGQTIFRARMDLVCFKLRTGRPTRMSPALAKHYRVLPDIAEALMTESLDARD